MAGPGILQALVIGLVILGDQTGKNIYPRWVGYFNLWCAFAFTPGVLLPFFKTGPFAWNGALSYYIPYFCWLCWYTTASIYMIKEVRRRMVGAEAAAASGRLAAA